MKKDTQVHKEYIGVYNQFQKLHKSRIENKDWFLKADNQSNKVLKKNNLRSGIVLSLS